MTVSNVTPKVQYTGNGNTTEFGFTFVVPASLDTGTITDSTASISLGSTTLTVTTADLFYTSDLQGKTITIAGAGSGSSTLTTTIVTVDSATQVTVADAASVTVSNADIVVTTGKTGTTMKNTAEIEVYVDSTLQTYTTDYTVRLDVGDDANKQGSVLFTSAPASSTTVTIARNIELSRTSDFQPGGALTAKELNAQFDNVVMAVQDQKNDDDRYIQFPQDEPASTSAVLPNATTRAGKFFVFDSSGDINVSNNINLPDADLTVDTVTAANVNTTNSTITTGTITNLTATTADINGGNIDGVTIGGTTPQGGNFTTLDATNLDVNSVATLNHVDIFGGDIDNTVIGATTPTTGTFTNLTVTGTLSNPDGNFVLGEVTARALKGEGQNDLSITGNANVSITAGGGTSEYVVLDDKVSFDTANTSITVGARTHTGKLIQSPNSDIVIDAYKGGSAGKLVVVSDDGIHVDGVDPKIKGLLQLKLEDGDTRNNILLSNSTDIDTAGIQLNQQQNTTIQLGQITFPPDLQAATDSIDVGLYPRLQYRKRVVISNSGQSFTYPSAALGDKLIKSGSSDDFGYVVEVVTGAQTTSSVTYVVLTNKQTWATTGPFIVVDGLGQTLQFTAASGTPAISTQNNDSGFFVGYDDSFTGKTTSDLPEGSNLYYTDSRADARVTSGIGSSSINALSDVNTTTVTPTDGDVLTWDNTASYWKPEAPLTAQVTSVAGKTGAVTLETNDVAESSGGRLYYTDTRFDNRLATKTTDNLTEGSTNFYFTNEKVDDRVSNLLVAGTGISLSYNDPANTLTITNTDAGTNLVDDTSPQLGNGLDVNGHEIFSLSNQDIKIQPNGTGATLFGADNTNAEISTNGTGDLLLRTNGSTTTAAANSGQIKIEDGTDGDIYITPHGDGQIDLDSYVWPKNGLGSVDQYLKINTVSGGVAQLAWVTPTFTNDLVNDTTPQLGGDLDVNGRAIVTVGNSNINLQPDASGTGVVLIDGIQWPTDNGSNGQFLQTNGTGTSDWATVTQATGNELENVVEDTTPQLGGNLDLNGQSIITTSGDITLAPDSTGGVAIDGDSNHTVVELHNAGANKRAGIIIHPNNKGDYTDSAVDSMLYHTGIQIEEKGDYTYPALVYKNNSINGYPYIWAAKARPSGGTDYSTDDYMDSGEILFSYYGAPYNGAASAGSEYYTAGARTQYKASEDHSSGNLGCKMEFDTINNGASSPTTKMTIDDNIECNTGLVLQQLSSDPTGTNGMMYYNTTTHKFRGYANGSWVDLH